MKLEKMIEELTKMMEIVGKDAEVPVMMFNYGENDYIIPKFGVIANLEDRDGKKFKCALIGEDGGEELTKEGIPYYKWQCKKDRI